MKNTDCWCYSESKSCTSVPLVSFFNTKDHPKKKKCVRLSQHVFSVLRIYTSTLAVITLQEVFIEIPPYTVYMLFIELGLVYACI